MYKVSDICIILRKCMSELLGLAWNLMLSDIHMQDIKGIQTRGLPVLLHRPDFPVTVQRSF